MKKELIKTFDILKEEKHQIGLKKEKVKKQLTKANKQLEIYNNQIDEKNTKLKALRLKMGVEISDHALVRYIDRVLNISIDSIRDDILELIKEGIKKENKIYCKNNIFATISNNTVMTIVKDKK